MNTYSKNITEPIERSANQAMLYALGLNENDKIDLNFSNTGKNKLFYDVIYNPAETIFLKEAKVLGNKTENGGAMFIYQASEAFKLWHGIEPEVNFEILKLLKND